MSGLIVLGVLGAWFAICFFLAKLIFSKVRNLYIKNIAAFTVSVFVFPIPLIDEIRGGLQFKSLCERNSIYVVDEEGVRGKVVFSAPKTYSINTYILPIKVFHFSYKDVDTGDVLISWNNYESKGGWLAQYLKLLGNESPYTFNGYCYPKGAYDGIFKRLQIIQVELK